MMRATAPAEDQWWKRVGLMFLIGVSVLWLARWPRLPLFLDPYYHLLTMQGFLRAGGIVLHDYWEFVPVGRPHLYPPLFHILLTLLAQLHLSPLTIGRFVSWAGLPSLLATLWCVGKRLFNAKTACFWLIAALMPYTWLVESAITTPATLALALLLWLWLAIERERWLAAALLSGGLWYLHLGIPWLALATCGIYSWWRPHRRKIWLVIIAGLIIGSPWLWHLWHHRAALGTHARQENQYVEFYPLFSVCAGWGMWLAWRAGGAKRFIVALFLGFLPLAWLYWYRWMNAQGMLPLVLAAGCALEAFFDRGLRWLNECAVPLRRGALLFACAGLLWAINPAWMRMPSPPHLVWSQPVWNHLLPPQRSKLAVNEVSLYSPWVAELASWVAAHTSPRAVLWSDLPYVGGLVGVLTNRVIANAMFYEVQPDAPVHPLRSADALLWFKDPERPGYTPPAQLARMGFRLKHETEFAWVYQRAQPVTAWRVAPVVCPLVMAWGITALWFVLIVLDFCRSAGYTKHN